MIHHTSYAELSFRAKQQIQQLHSRGILHHSADKIFSVEALRNLGGVRSLHALSFVSNFA